MDFKDAYPDYIAIEKHIRRAHLERSLAIALMFAEVADSTLKGLKKLAAVFRGVPSAARAKLPLPSR